jgi:hypothetical protein
VVDELVRKGITAEELERARVPLMRQAEENATSNAWWLFALDEAQTKPQFVEGQGRQKEIYSAITRAELNDLARLLFSGAYARWWRCRSGWCGCGRDGWRFFRVGDDGNCRWR